MTTGYNFYFKDGSDVLTFPITPSELSITVGSNNKKVTLISEGDVNILKSPSLTEVEFDARFPMRQYPYAREFVKFQTYWDKFKELKEKKKSFSFIVARTTPKGSRTWDTNILVALEDIKIKESAEEGDDVLVSFNLKQFKEYGVKTIKLKTDKPTDEEAWISINKQIDLLREEIAKGFHFKFNVAVILRADLQTQINTLSTAVNSFIYTPNEARAMLDLEAKEGGDRLLGNGASIPVELTGSQYIKPEETPGETNEGGGQDNG